MVHGVYFQGWRTFHSAIHGTIQKTILLTTVTWQTRLHFLRWFVDDPRDLSQMSYPSNQFRHKVVVYGTAPTFWGISVGARFSGIGGTRYSLIVGGNVNGDFVDSNDLAYIYNPNDPNTPQYLKDGINNISF